MSYGPGDAYSVWFIAAQTGWRRRTAAPRPAAGSPDRRRRLRAGIPPVPGRLSLPACWPARQSPSWRKLATDGRYTRHAVSARWVNWPHSSPARSRRPVLSQQRAAVPAGLRRRRPIVLGTPDGWADLLSSCNTQNMDGIWWAARTAACSYPARMTARQLSGCCPLLSVVASPARLTCSARTAPANSRCPTTGTRAVACTSAVAGTVRYRSVLTLIEATRQATAKSSITDSGEEDSDGQS